MLLTQGVAAPEAVLGHRITFRQRRELIFPFVFQDLIALVTVNQIKNYSNVFHREAPQSVRAEG